jgi:arsenate reductase
MKILFMCVANSARSQLAEAIAKQVFGSRAEIYSAGSRPTTLNPFAVRAIDEVGADSRSLWSKSVVDLPKEFVQDLDYVVTLCAEEVCPVIISQAKKLHWPLPDPAGQEGSDDEQMTRFRHTRDEIQKRLEIFSREIS